jgi:serine/threonine-protein kinase
MAPPRWQRIEKLYHDAAARPDRERGPFLEEACAGDEGLRREVEVLLAQPPEDSWLATGGALAGTPALQAEHSSAVGSRIGAYQILGLLGAGGMGEVYRARDPRLDREVAIKVLPPGFAAVPDRAARFEREARVLASLNHPAIAAIYGFERDADTAFLILELVPGETLLERIARGPLPVDDALRLAKQIADALEAAHDKGIVHRDLKPANIKVTAEDRAKVLDFGLAKALSTETDDPSSGVSAAPTITTPAQTKLGVVLGTAAYMAPEQARGKAVDKRADIWAFGCVLYEMLTGRRAFISDEVTDTLAFVLTKDPDWQSLPAATPDSIRRLLRRCLEKDRTRRLADIADARIEIEDALVGDATTGVPPAPLPARRPVWRQALPWALAATTSAVATLLLLQRDVPPTATSVPVMRMSADIGVEGPAGLVGPGIALSPDGSTVAFVARDAKRSARAANQLFIRRVDQLEAHPLPGTEGALSPFFSPDGMWIAFFATGALKKVAIAAGTVVTLCSVRSVRGGDWLEDGTIVFQDLGSTFERGPLMRVSDAGGKPAPVFAEEENPVVVRWPQMLPGGRTILATVPIGTVLSSNMPRIVTMTLPAGERKVIRDGQFARYAASGHLIYGDDGTLFAAPFDVDRLELTGPAVPVVQGIRMDPVVGNAEFALSRTGTLVYVRGTGTDRSAPIHWLDRRGQSPPLHDRRLSWSSPRFSPDGLRIALTIADATSNNNDIWIYDWERDILTRLTTFPGTDTLPVWSPDGRWIAYGSQRDRPGIFNLYAQRSDGTGEVIRLTDGSDPQLPDAWHPTGNAIVFHEGSPSQGQQNVRVVPLEGDSMSGWKAGAPSLLLGGPGLKALVSFSPDGRWFAYTSNESGTNEVYVRPYPGPGGRWQISGGGGNEPRWSRTRPELLFRSPAGVIYAVRFTAEGDSFRAERPHVWSPGRLVAPPAINVGSMFDLHPDGERFAVALPAVAPPEERLDRLWWVFGFFDELRRLAPTAK